MYQKDLVRAAWKAAGLYDDPDPRLREFLALLDDPAQCWPELIGACRRDLGDYKAKVAQPILDGRAEQPERPHVENEVQPAAMKEISAYDAQ